MLTMRLSLKSLTGRDITSLQKKLCSLPSNQLNLFELLIWKQLLRSCHIHRTNASCTIICKLYLCILKHGYNEFVYLLFSVPLMLDVCNVLSKPVMIWVASWTHSRYVHRGRPISIPLQVSMATISLELLQTFQGQLSDPLQPQLRISQPVLRTNDRSSTWSLTYRAQILHQPPRPTAKKTSAKQASSEAEVIRVSVYNMVLLGFP